MKEARDPAKEQKEEQKPTTLSSMNSFFDVLNSLLKLSTVRFFFIRIFITKQSATTPNTEKNAGLYAFKLLSDNSTLGGDKTRTGVVYDSCRRRITITTQNQTKGSKLSVHNKTTSDNSQH
jgi:hypothetical protein